jgi:hypothetical protein
MTEGQPPERDRSAQDRLAIQVRDEHEAADSQTWPPCGVPVAKVET